MDLDRAARVALAVIAFGAVTLPAAGESAPRTGEAFADVIVTDAAGSPVAGLRPADIEVLEDGTPVPVVSCVGPTQVRGASAGEIARARQLVVAIFVDDATTAAERRAAFAEADTALGEILGTARSRVLIASGGASVAIRQPFTGDAGQVGRALEALEAARASDAGSAGTPPGRGGVATTTLGALVDSLGALPGRKAFVYVGGRGPTPAAGSSPAERSALLRALADKASAAGVTLYTIGVPGDGPPGTTGAVTAAVGRSPGTATEVTAVEPAAPATGGLAVAEGAGGGGALVQVARDFKSAWSVGFAPSSRGDGKVHRLTIKVKREGVRVRARAAFLDLGPDERMAERTPAALLLGFEDNPLGVQVSLTSESKPKDAAQLLAALVTVPLGGLAFEAKGVSHDCDVGLWLAARDADGRVVRGPKVEFPVSVPNDRLLTALSQTAGYTLTVPMTAGPGTIAVTVRDEIGEQTSTTVVAVPPLASTTPGVTP